MAAAWDDNRISEQKAFTDGRIVVVGSIPIARSINPQNSRGSGYPYPPAMP